MKRVVETKLKEVGIEDVTSQFVGIDQTCDRFPGRKGFITTCPSYKWSVLFIGWDYDFRHEHESFEECLESLMKDHAHVYSFETKNELLEWLKE